jgi:hypothetical protein
MREHYGETVTKTAGDVTEPVTAVILVLPTSCAVISPVLDTVAAPVLLDAHVKLNPCRTLPDASYATACACIVWRRPSEDDGTVTTTVATDVPPPPGFPDDAVTVIETAFDVTEPVDAVMDAVPACCPLTTPSDETAATFGLLELHVKLVPESVSPDASSATARSGNDVDAASCVVGAVSETLAAATGGD